MDAAINFEDHCAGLRVVIRDVNKNFVAAAIKAAKLHGDNLCRSRSYELGFKHS